MILVRGDFAKQILNIAPMKSVCGQYDKIEK